MTRYSREMLLTAVGPARSMSDVLRNLGIPLNGGAHAHIRRRLTQFGIDTSHLLGQAHRRGLPNPRRRTPAEVLVVRAAERKRAAPDTLRRALIAIGRPYRCAQCLVDGVWNGRRLVLHVDHVDGQFWNCQPDNLRFLCPNCHSQTPTYLGTRDARRAAGRPPIDEPTRIPSTPRGSGVKAAAPGLGPGVREGVGVRIPSSAPQGYQ
jgi:5-methylcytosine-specific restriction endonuclease McrA